MSNQLSSKDKRRDHPMFDPNDYCEWCREPANDDLNEWQNIYICSRCLERKRESAEEQARRDEYSDRVIRENNERKSR